MSIFLEPVCFKTPLWNFCHSFCCCCRLPQLLKCFSMDLLDVHHRIPILKSKPAPPKLGVLPPPNTIALDIDELLILQYFIFKTVIRAFKCFKGLPNYPPRLLISFTNFWTNLILVCCMCPDPTTDVHAYTSHDQSSYISQSFLPVLLFKTYPGIYYCTLATLTLFQCTFLSDCA